MIMTLAGPTGHQHLCGYSVPGQGQVSGILSPQVKWPRCLANRLLQFSSEVRKAWTSLLLPTRQNTQSRWSRNSSLSRAMSCGLDARVSSSGRGKKFSLFHSFQTDSGAHPASSPMGIWDSLPGLKRAGRDADHSPPSSTKVKNGGGISPHPPTSSWREA
jgi:hypothetical protein